MLVRGDIGQFIHKPGDITQMSHLFIRDALLFHLGLEGRYDGAEVGISAAFAKAVNGALDLHDTKIYRMERIGDSTIRIIVGMDTKRGRDMLLDLRDNSRNFERHGAAVGVTQNNAVGIGLLGRLEGLDGILGVGLVAVKEVLGVVKNLWGMLFQILQRVKDQFQILFQ